MARFNRVKLDDIYFTSTGLESGTPCKLQVAGLDALLMDKTGSVTPSADGTPFVELVDTGKKGIKLEIAIESLKQPVFEALKGLLNNANNNGSVLTLEITGKTGDFALDVLPLLPKPMTPATFNNFYIKNTVIRVITT